jgi:hypothetical protein
VASVGDALGMLAQMFAAGRGAHVKERDADSLAMSRFSNEEKALRDLYRQKTDKYEDRVITASASDANRAYAQHQSDIKSIRDALAKKVEYDYNSQRNAEADKLKALGLELDNRKLEETQAYNRERIRQADERNKSYSREVASRVNRNNASAAKDKFVPVDVKANPGDPDAISDTFGDKVHRYNFSKDEYESLLAQAKSKAVSDPAWADKHRGVLIEKPEVQVNGIEKKTVGSYKFNDRALVEAYVKEFYDGKFPAKRTFATGTEAVLENPNLPVDKKIAWLKENEKLSDMEIMKVLNERGMNQYSPQVQIPVLPGLLSGNAPAGQAGAGGSGKEVNGGKGKKLGW